MTVAEDYGMVQVCTTITIYSGTVLANAVTVMPTIMQGYATMHDIGSSDFFL